MSNVRFADNIWQHEVAVIVDKSLNKKQLILPEIIISTFRYSRPILVVLAQWQQLMMSFIHCFAQKSKICHRMHPKLTDGAHDKEKL